MENYKDRSVGGNDEIVTFAQERLQESHASKGRPDINDINRRNAEQEKQEKRSSHTMIGIAVLLIVFVTIVIYFFS